MILQISEAVKGILVVLLKLMDRVVWRGYRYGRCRVRSKIQIFVREWSLRERATGEAFIINHADVRPTSGNLKLCASSPGERYVIKIQGADAELVAW